MTRRTTATLAMVMIGAIVISDFFVNPPNPYRAPAIVALGSGASSGGGFCGALPD